MEARRADVDLPGPDSPLGQQILERLQNGRFAGGFLRALRPERLGCVLLEAQSARFIDLKLGKLETPRPKVHRQK